MLYRSMHRANLKAKFEGAHVVVNSLLEGIPTQCGVYVKNVIENESDCN